AHPGATPAAYAEVPGVLTAIARYGTSRAGVPLQSVLLLTSKEARGHGRIGFVRYRKHVAADARRSTGCPEQRRHRRRLVAPARQLRRRVATFAAADFGNADLGQQSGQGIRT